jgi:hypothetical protein
MSPTYAAKTTVSVEQSRAEIGPVAPSSDRRGIRDRHDARHAPRAGVWTVSAFCRSCGEEVVWTKTAKGKNMPVDAQPVEDGNLILSRGEDGTLRSVYVRAGATDQAGEPRYTSHFATCVHANQHRSRT